MKKKILFVINSLGCGGAEKSLVSLLSLFDYGKYDVDLLMMDPGGMFMSLLPKDVNVLPQPDYLRFCREGGFSPKYSIRRLYTSVGLRSKPKCCGKPLHDAQAYWKYAGGAFDVLPGKYDAAVAWGQGNPTHFIAEKVNAVRKIAVINVNYEGAGHNKDFDRKYYSRYDIIANVSDDLNRMTKEVFPEFSDRMITLYDINNADLINRMAEEKDPFSDVGDELKIVTAGRMTFQKGYDIAVLGANILKQKGLRFKWYFVGDGPERHKVEDLIAQHDLADNIVLAGAVSNPYVYMKHADIYVQTSRFEGYCLTLCEARILNTPVISTDFDVVHNQLTNEVNGLIVGIDPSSVADGIIRLWKDAGLREKIRENIMKEKKGNKEEINKLYKMIEG